MRQTKVRPKHLQVGDKVTIANRFFSNHGLKRCLVGTGTVLLPSTTFVRVMFKYHYIFLYCKNKKYIQSLKMLDGVDKGYAIVEIHPVYLERV